MKSGSMPLTAGHNFFMNVYRPTDEEESVRIGATLHNVREFSVHWPLPNLIKCWYLYALLLIPKWKCFLFLKAWNFFSYSTHYYLQPVFIINLSP